MDRKWGSLEFAGSRVEPGETSDVRLKVGELYTADPVSIPVTVVRGRKPGPTLFITAAVHGDELNGVAIIRDLLAQDLGDLTGTLITVPVANVLGFLAQDRRLPDRRDLNRAFPGSERGSLTSRLAHTLFREVVQRSDYGLDLHTGGGERSNYPQVRADLSMPRVAALARAFGCPVLVDGPGPDRSLRKAALGAGVPTICYEAGGPGLFERPFIDLGTAGVVNLLAHLGMIAGETHAAPFYIEVRKSRWVRARLGGILDLRVELGEPLRRRQVISINTNPFGRERNQLRAPHPGLVLGLTRLPLVHPGDAVCHLARLGAGELDSWSRFWESGGGRLRP